METVLITGGTGLVGTALSLHLLELGYKVIVLGRSLVHPSDSLLKKAVKEKKLAYRIWNPSEGSVDEQALMEADHVVNLAGAGVADKRWTARRKLEIRDSRVNSGNTLAKALKKMGKKPKTFVQASAIGWYGPDAPESGVPFTEDQPLHDYYLGNTCKEWENSTLELEQLGIRRVVLRIGIVLSSKGGALKEFQKPLMGGVAAVMGNGKQMISWIEISDLCRMIVFASQQESLKGVFNAVAPEPVSNRTLTITLAKHLRGRFYLPVHVPSFLLHLMLGEMSIEILKSTTVSASKIQDAGFQFAAPTISEAIEKSYPLKG